MTPLRSLLLVLSGATACGTRAEPLLAPAVAPAPVLSASTLPPPALPPPAATATTIPAGGAASLVQLSAEPIALPGATAPVSLDYLFYEPRAARVWVPAGGSGSVDVFDPSQRAFTRIIGFTTVERESHGKQRRLGPSAGAIGDGVAYIGNRATAEICVVNLHTLQKGACSTLSSGTDGVDYVPSTREVWVTTPSAKSIVILDASKGELRQTATIRLEGEPEGYALDEPRGWFFTNLEDKGSTLAIDLKTHAVKATWNAGCSADGPRGLAADSGRGLVFVACTDHVQVLDAAHDGARLGTLDTGGGLDNIDYDADRGLLYAAAGKSARLTVARIGEHGQLTTTAIGTTAPGARNAVADVSGNVYVADPQGARLLVFRAPAPGGVGN